jgi:3'(2'), 5'-bisphosphate nucleotidase
MSRLYDLEHAVAIQSVSEAARLCRAVAIEISPDVMAKRDKSPVTVADFGSQALICRALAQAFPNDPVIAEEDAADLRRPENAAILAQVLRHVRSVWSQADHEDGISIDDDQICRWIDHGGGSEFSERFWTLDPIDGTKGFLRGEQYAVALALIVEGRVVVAALACPNLSVVAGAEPPDCEAPRVAIFAAVSGQGAFVLPAQGAGTARSAPERVTVSLRDQPSNARFCESVESGHSAQGDAAAVAARLGITAPPIRMDSQAKYAVVARGEADIYLRLPTRADYYEKIWDHAAGALIVQEAGGIVTDITGRPLEFNHGRELTANRGVIVSNGQLHQPLIEAIRALGVGSSSHD